MTALAQMSWLYLSNLKATCTIPDMYSADMYSALLQTIDKSLFIGVYVSVQPLVSLHACSIRLSCLAIEFIYFYCPCNCATLDRPKNKVKKQTKKPTLPGFEPGIP